MTTRARTLELLHVPECPGVQPFLAALELAVDDPVETIEIRTEAEAGARGMAGSPTLLVDGRDIFAAQGTGAGLSCRLYRDVDDRLVRAPSAAQISSVLRRIPS